MDKFFLFDCGEGFVVIDPFTKKHTRCTLNPMEATEFTMEEALQVQDRGTFSTQRIRLHVSSTHKDEQIHVLKGAIRGLMDTLEPALHQLSRALDTARNW